MMQKGKNQALAKLTHCANFDYHFHRKHTKMKCVVLCDALKCDECHIFRRKHS
jgi:hypothetical protein